MNGKAKEDNGAKDKRPLSSTVSSLQDLDKDPRYAAMLEKLKREADAFVANPEVKSVLESL